MNRNVIQLIVLLVFACIGCTIRHSQSLSGSVPKESGREVKTSSSGFELLNMTLSEPSSASEQVIQLMRINNCERLNQVEVDYRTIGFLLFNIPKVKVRGTCVE